MNSLLSMIAQGEFQWWWIAALVVILIAAAKGAAWIVRAVWKVSEELRVKPRDFQIKSLDKDNEKLRSNQKESDPPGRQGKDFPSKSLRPTTVEATPQSDAISEEGNGEGGRDALTLAKRLRDIDIAYAKLNEESMTRLQLQSVEEYYVGRNIVWEATVFSVSPNKWNSEIRVGISGVKRGFAAAYFKKEDRELLIYLKKGDSIVIEGRIHCAADGIPVIEDCKITKSNSRDQ